MLGLIIYGTRGITYSAGSGNFHCPQCSAPRDWTRRRVRRFFTLYFIPLIPLDLVGEYIECQCCEGTFKETVLEYDPSKEKVAFEAQFHRAMKRFMVLMLLADGQVDPAEVEAIRSLYRSLTERELSEEDVRAEIAEVQRTGADVEKCLADLAGTLNDNGKAMVVKAAFMVALADGQFPEEEKKLLTSIASTLQMSEAQFSAVLAEMTRE